MDLDNLTQGLAVVGMKGRRAYSTPISSCASARCECRNDVVVNFVEDMEMGDGTTC